MSEGNNNTIDGPSYYRLSDGTYLEDALVEVNPYMPGPMWDACVYRHRAGHKDGEPMRKDLAKVRHYLEFIARNYGMCYATARLRMRKILANVYERHGNPWSQEGGAK